MVLRRCRSGLHRRRCAFGPKSLARRLLFFPTPAPQALFLHPPNRANHRRLLVSNARASFLITRKKAVDPSFMNGTEIGIWVRTRWRETGDIHTIVDSSLAAEVLNSNVLEQVKDSAFVGSSCTRRIHT
ncbi:hypothetical protein K1719_017702 [Acacia pycnantha]|nr:hypothetical protein K1719_017702 [Acacia pycnantha]